MKESTHLESYFCGNFAHSLFIESLVSSTRATDECDAVFRRRTSNEGTSEVTRASAVNQILSKLDGVEALDNVLLIGMTNRKELLDPALLRPGRLEVHIEIPLPDENSRREILQIQFGQLRALGRLSAPLCAAIDGVQADESHRSCYRRLGVLRKKTLSCIHKAAKP